MIPGTAQALVAICTGPFLLEQNRAGYIAWLESQAERVTLRAYDDGVYEISDWRHIVRFHGWEGA